MHKEMNWHLRKISLRVASLQPRRFCFSNSEIASAFFLCQFFSCLAKRKRKPVHAARKVHTMHSENVQFESCFLSSYLSFYVMNETQKLKLCNLHA